MLNAIFRRALNIASIRLQRNQSQIVAKDPDTVSKHTSRTRAGILTKFAPTITFPHQ